MIKRLSYCIFVVAGCLVLLGFLVPRAILAADEPEPIEYDIFLRNGHISVWLNLSQLISSKQVERLKEGIDFAIEYRLILSQPRRLWGSKQVAETTGLIKVSYRIVTEDFTLSALKLGLESSRRFVSLAKLHQFISDSIVVDITDFQGLNRHRQYVLEVKLTCILLTTFNLASGADSSGASESPLKYLFRKFLHITGFGHEEHSFKSRPFSLSEVRSKG